MDIIEIFGRKLKIVENDTSNNCKECALNDFCYPRDYPYPCKDSNGNINRHFKKAQYSQWCEWLALGLQNR